MRWIIDLNSFEVEADSKEEATEKAEAMLRDDVTLAFPISVIEDKDEG